MNKPYCFRGIQVIGEQVDYYAVKYVEHFTLHPNSPVLNYVKKTANTMRSSKFYFSKLMFLELRIMKSCTR